MNIFIKSTKRVGRPMGITFAPVQTVELRGKELVPVSKMIPVVMVALIDQLVLVPAQDILVLWDEDEVTSMSALEQEVALRLEELNTSEVAVEDVPEIGLGEELPATCDGDGCGNCESECGGCAPDQQEA